MNNFEETGGAIVRARVSPNILEAYDLIRDNCDLTQSDLIRLCPLIFMLFLEGNFTSRRKDIEKSFQQLENEVSDKNLLKKMKYRIKTEELRFRRADFTDYLKKIAQDLDDESKKSIHPDIITRGRDGLPDYTIFPKRLEEFKGSIEKDTLLKKVAEESAGNVKNKDKVKIPKHPTPQNPIPQEYWLDLLMAAKRELGSFLDQGQMEKIRTWFCDAVHSRENKTDWALKAAAKMVAEYVRKNDDEIFPDEFIPSHYDGLLLTQARYLLGRYLTSAEKKDVRHLLIKEFN